jgi:hypothetical protein
VIAETGRYIFYSEQVVNNAVESVQSLQEEEITGITFLSERLQKQNNS